LKKLDAAIGLILTFCWAGAALAENRNNVEKDTRYLALGDSVAFGFNPTVPVSLSNYHGYPKFTSDALHRKVANASCFGESSGSMLSASAPDLGCHAWKAAGLPLFVPYSGTQMDYAVDYLQENPNPELVTINIGGNDLGLLIETCNGDVTCELHELPRVLAAYGQNLFTIFKRMRTEAEYEGPIVLLTYYAVNYHDPVEVAGLSALNSVAADTAPAFGVKVADGFNAFFVATIPFNGDSCAAGLLVKLPSGGCDRHPSVAGQKLLAATVTAQVSDSEDNQQRGGH
jgi:lysophospholipase L1-like esterase